MSNFSWSLAIAKDPAFLSARLAWIFCWSPRFSKTSILFWRACILRSSFACSKIFSAKIAPSRGSSSSSEITGVDEVEHEASSAAAAGGSIATITMACFPWRSKALPPF